VEDAAVRRSDDRPAVEGFGGGREIERAADAVDVQTSRLSAAAAAVSWACNTSNPKTAGDGPGARRSFFSGKYRRRTRQAVEREDGNVDARPLAVDGQVADEPLEAAGAGEEVGRDVQHAGQGPGNLQRCAEGRQPLRSFEVRRSKLNVRRSHFVGKRTLNI